MALTFVVKSLRSCSLFFLAESVSGTLEPSSKENSPKTRLYCCKELSLAVKFLKNTNC